MDYLLNNLINYALEKMAADEEVDTYAAEMARYKNERLKSKKRKMAAALAAAGGTAAIYGAIKTHGPRVNKINARYQDIIDTTPFDLDTNKGRRDFRAHTQGERPEAFIRRRNLNAALSTAGLLGGTAALYGSGIGLAVDKNKMDRARRDYLRAGARNRMERRRQRRIEKEEK